MKDLLSSWDATAVLARMREALPGAAVYLHEVPMLLGLVVAALGVTALLFGARWRRTVAVPGGAFHGALVGYLASAYLATRFGLPLWTAMLTPAAVLAVAGGLAPICFPAVTGAMLGMVVALWIKLPVYVLPAIGLAAGAILQRLFALIGASFIGVVFLCAAFFCLVGGSVPATIAQHPFVLLTLAGILIVAGTAFQYADGWQADARFSGPGRPGKADANATMRV